jgi:hypothetical protein
MFFLARAGEQIAPTEKRAIRWLPYEAARDLLTFADSREVLERGDRYLREARL